MRTIVKVNDFRASHTMLFHIPNEQLGIDFVKCNREVSNIALD